MKPCQLVVPAIVVFAILCGSSVQMHAWQAPAQAVVHPKRYASPSGQFVLSVDPSDIFGRGPGMYQLTRDGKTVWQGKKPYTLYESIVMGDGTVVGYSYSNGLEGFAKDRALDPTPGDLRVVILDSMGRERLNEAVQRRGSRFLHARPNPCALGMFVHPVNDQVVVRITNPDVNRQVESWRKFQLSSGKPLGSTDIADDMEGGLGSISTFDAQPIAGTPLVLVHWWRYGHRAGGVNLGARFTLVDPSQATIWSLDLPNDYTILGDEDAQDRLIDSVRRRGAIFDTRESGRFQLWFVRDAQRVTFEVRREREAWIVREVGRAPYKEPPAEQGATLPVRKLRYLGEMNLEVGPKTMAAVRDVLSFDFDSRGRLGLLRKGEEDRPAFLLMKQNGDVLREASLDCIKDDKDAEGPALAWINGDRWLVYLSPSVIDAKSPGWWLDASNGQVREIPGFDCPSIEALDGTGDGGFVVLATRIYRHTMENEIIAFDKQAQQLWSLKKDPSDPNIQFSRDGLAVTTMRQITALCTSRGTIDFFDLKGKYMKTLNLRAIWKHAPNYLVGLAADWEGGFIIEDFRGNSPCVWMGAEGGVRLALAPCRFQDNRAAELRSFRIAPDGKLWATDRSCIAEVSQDGVVTRILGAPPSPERLETIADITMDMRGNIYLVDERTGTVHAFTNEGKRVRTFTPDPRDFLRHLKEAHVTVDSEGGVYLTDDTGDPLIEGAEYVCFSSSGERVGKRRISLEGKRWYAQPETGNTWVVGHESVFLVNTSGEPIREIRRQPDGKWLEESFAACVASDGSLAVWSFGSENLWKVNLYSPSGEPIRTIIIPLVFGLSPFAYRLAYNGRWIVLSSGNEALIVGADEQSMERSSFAEARIKGAQSWCFLPSSAPGELWIVEGKRTSIYKFALP